MDKDYIWTPKRFRLYSAVKTEPDRYRLVFGTIKPKSKPPQEITSTFILNEKEFQNLKKKIF
ncbi:hypothetical protein LCGC14_0196300 [marine sediment metagenome]|uniref:Uncharacterized protein n=1 Tax=marine sediment metagenome TaxID=412755 RepID=A0A0F9V287_9ZZZZ